MHGPEEQKQNRPSAVELITAIYGICAPIPLWRPIEEKPLKKCLLPGCENMTRHNGGYCCAEHCRLDKRRRGQ